MDVVTIGYKKYEATENHLGHTWTIPLKGGLLANERKAAKAADAIITVSFRCLVAADMIDAALSDTSQPAMRGLYFNHWMRKASLLREFSTATPTYVHGFKTGSESIDFFYFDHVSVIASRTINALIEAAPQDLSQGRNLFGAHWGRNVGRTDPRDIRSQSGFKLDELAKTFYQRSLNVRTLVLKTPTADQELREYAVQQATAHLNATIPTLTPAPAAPRIAAPAKAPVVVQGNRVQTTLNVMMPEIEEKLARVTDPAAKAILEARIAQIKARGERDAAAQPDPVDLMATLDVLEETLDARTDGDAPSPAGD